MREQTYKIYNIEEVKEMNPDFFDKEIERTIQNLIEWNFETLGDQLECIAADDYDLHDIKLEYDLGFSQGDGLCFNCDNLLDSKYILSAIRKELTPAEKSELTKMQKDGFKITSHNNNTYNYCYASKHHVECNDDWYNYSTTKKREELIKKVIDSAANIYLSICGALEKIGYGCYEVSNDDAVEDLKEQDAEYILIGENHFQRI